MGNRTSVRTSASGSCAAGMPAPQGTLTEMHFRRPSARLINAVGSQWQNSERLCSVQLAHSAYSNGVREGGSSSTCVGISNTDMRKRRGLGCVNLPPPAAKGSQEIGLPQPSLRLLSHVCTGCLGKLKAKLCDWAVRPVRVGCYSWAAVLY